LETIIYTNAPIYSGDNIWHSGETLEILERDREKPGQSLSVALIISAIG
jgi:hypothetical protein